MHMKLWRQIMSATDAATGDFDNLRHKFYREKMSEVKLAVAEGGSIGKCGRLRQPDCFRYQIFLKSLGHYILFITLSRLSINTWHLQWRGETAYYFRSCLSVCVCAYHDWQSSLLIINWRNLVIMCVMVPSLSNWILVTLVTSTLKAILTFSVFQCIGDIRKGNTQGLYFPMTRGV